MSIGIVGFFLPIVILCLLVFFILLGRRGLMVMPKMAYGKRIRWTVTGYLIILLIATGAVYFMPKKALLEGEEMSVDTWEIGNEFYEAASNGELVDKFDQYIINKQQIEVTDDTLDVQWQQVEDEELPIIVEVKDDDSMVDVTLYQTPTIVNGIDVTDETPVVQLETNSNDVKLINSGRTEMELIAFKKEFPISQFTGEYNWMEHEIQRGETILYMRVPKDLHINYPEAGDISYVGE